MDYKTKVRNLQVFHIFFFIIINLEKPFAFIFALNGN